MSFYFTKLSHNIKKGWIPEIDFVSFLCRKLTGTQFYISPVFSFYLVFSEIKNLKKAFFMKVLSSCLEFKKYHNLISAPLFWRRRRRRRRRRIYRQRYYRRRQIWRRRYYYRRRYYRRRHLFYRRRHIFYRRRHLFYRRRYFFHRRRYG